MDYNLIVTITFEYIRKRLNVKIPESDVRKKLEAQLPRYTDQVRPIIKGIIDACFDEFKRLKTPDNVVTLEQGQELIKKIEDETINPRN